MELTQENAKLSRELQEMGHRIRNIENVSRSCNLEIQALPESKNEDLLEILKKIISEIDVVLPDRDIISIRRIAKKNPKSE